jgi:hypothetical protein
MTSAAEIRIGPIAFAWVAGLRPELDQYGRPAEFTPYKQDGSARHLHASGAGPFCRIRLSGIGNFAGVYMITINRKPVYVGVTVGLSDRFGPRGYGTIYARNCYPGGQSTNCHVNGELLAAAKEGRLADLWFLPIPEVHRRAHIEQATISYLQPIWNRIRY